MYRILFNGTATNLATNFNPFTPVPSEMNISSIRTQVEFLLTSEGQTYTHLDTLFNYLNFSEELLSTRGRIYNEGVKLKI